jgi:Na+/H+-dicarboxylate symporter
MSKQARAHWLLSPWTIIFGILLGAALGYYEKKAAMSVLPLARIFLAMLEMCALPLMVSAVSTSVAKLFREWRHTYMVWAIIAVILIGMALMSAIGVTISSFAGLGHNFSPDILQRLGQLLLSTAPPNEVASMSLNDLFLRLIPKNVLSAMVHDHFISVLAFALLMGGVMGVSHSPAITRIEHFLAGVFELFIEMINWFVYLLPFGLFAITAIQVASTGFSILWVLGSFILACYIGSIFMTIVFLATFAYRTGTPFWQTLVKLRTPLLVGFFSTSSFATLPFSLRALEENFRLNKTHINLMLPLGTCLNGIGTSFITGLFIVFMAHLYGIPLGFQHLAIIVFGSVLTAVASGGIPGIATFSFFSIVLTPLGLPLKTALILLMTMANVVDPVITLVNITGNYVFSTLFEKRDLAQHMVEPM